MLTDAQLKKIMPNVSDAKRRAALPILNAVAQQYEISNERRMAAWLATLAVESGELRYQEEIASGAAYEGRADLGNTQKGDGRRFKGHGRIQITGRANHQSYTNYLKRSKHLPFIDFIQQPTLLATEPYATDSAGWFWAKFKKLNAAADRGDFLTTQVKVNGRNRKTGLPNHWDVRNRYFIKGLSVLPDDFQVSAAVSMPAPSESPSARQDELSSDLTDLQTGQPEPPPTDPPIIQNAEQIINTGDAPTPGPAPADKEVTAPAKEGSTASSTKMTIAGIVVPGFVVTLISTIKQWVADGYLDAKQVGDTILGFISQNQKYVFILIGMLIVLLIVKKLVRQITFWIEMITKAVPSFNNITVVPADDKPKEPWWKIF